MGKSMVNVHDAKTHFSRLLERVAAGEEIVIAKAGRPVAKLVPSALYEGRIEPFNAAMAEVARAHGLHLVDLYTASKEMIPHNPHFFSHDGFHPSADGYRVWAHALYPAVAKAAMSGV